MRINSIVLAFFLTVSSIFSFAASSQGQIVNEVSPDSTYEKLGVKVGDRIISYDGKEVNTVKDSMELYNKLKNKAVKTVLIERNGKKQTLTYQIQ